MQGDPLHHESLLYAGIYYSTAFPSRFGDANG